MAGKVLIAFAPYHKPTRAVTSHPAQQQANLGVAYVSCL